MKHVVIAIEGPNFQDFEEAEVLRLPEEAEAIETKYGTCIVTHTELLPDSREYTGRIVCRLP